jgi:glycosyltransferase involved in cell wall biosynthesis
MSRPTEVTTSRSCSVANVCVLTSRVDAGAFANVARGLAEGFDRLGVSTDLLFIQGAPSSRLPASCRQHQLGGRSRTSFVQVARHLRRTRPDVVISLGWLLNAPAIAAAVVSGVQTRVLLNEASLMSYKAGVEHRHQRSLRIMPSVARIVYPLADGLGAVSEAVMDDLRTKIGVSSTLPMRVVPNPVDADRVRRLAGPVQDLESDTARFVTVGRLARQKNHALLVNAFRRVLRRRPSAHLTIVGSGPLEQELRSLAADLGEAITFVPQVDNPFPLIASGDTFVLSSEEEGFGLVLVEAMALGVPVVATDCPGGVREVLADGRSGLLVPPGDPGALADAMLEATDNESLRARLRGRGIERANEFSPMAIAARWLAFAESVPPTGPAQRLATRMRGSWSRC